MTRGRAILAALAVLAALAACGDSTGSGAAPARGTAITVNGTKVPASDVVAELRTIAGNRRFARVLQEEDDTRLVPEPGTIEPLVSQNWVQRWVNEILGEQELRRRGLRVTDEHRAAATKDLEQSFRGARVFAAFPEDFRRKVVEREARLYALRETFPATHEPSEAVLRELFTGVTRSCQEPKLIAQIFVDTKAEADRIAGELAGGADFAALAREHSTDSSAERGGVSMCIGSLRFRASEEAIQQAARATPIGGTSAPVETGDGYAILRALPLTFENAHDLLADDWHSQHPSPFTDFLAAQLADADVTVAERFGRVLPAGETIVIHPPQKPVPL
jgi:hypothetical protein